MLPGMEAAHQREDTIRVGALGIHATQGLAVAEGRALRCIHTYVGFGYRFAPELRAAPVRPGPDDHHHEEHL
jgi:hypothetical protein